jgi:ATP-binding cassette subfamily C protein LapB
MSIAPATDEENQDVTPRRWLRDALYDARGALRDTLLVSLFVNLLALAAPVFVLQVYDRVVFHAGLSTLKGLVIGMAIAILFDYLLRQARSRIFQAIGVSLEVAVGRALFDKVLGLPLRVLEGRPAAYWQSLFRDAETVRNAFSGPAAALVTDLPFAVIFLVLIFIIAAPVAWVLLVFLPLFVLLAWRSGKAMRDSAARERASTQSRDTLLSEMIAARATVKALALGDAMRPRWDDRHAAAIELSRERGQATDGNQVLANAMTLLTTVTLTAVGALAILDQRMTIGALIAANMLGARLIAPFTQLVGQWRMLTQVRQSIARLDFVFSLASERKAAVVDLGRPRGQVRLEQVTFAYDSQAAPVLDGIDGRIGAGGLHGVIGRNGSGKSTLLKLIAGLYAPQDGRVLLDEADLKQFTRRDLAGWVAYLPQECMLFAGTIRDNIAIANPDATDEAVIDAAKRAQVHQFIIDQPDGYATAIGEAGAKMSGGLRQRLALARTFLGSPPVLLLDEPTNNLDNDAERDLAGALREMARDSTIVAVTHSPAMLNVCDTILVLDEGRVAMAGPAREVLQRLQRTPANVQPLRRETPA